ncbi:MAG: RNA polymerase sigma factor [Candidatus Cryptobacteroides sp.]
MATETFREKFLPLAETLYKVAFYILESESDAKDAVQDLYLKLWKSRTSLSGISNPKAYCITLLKNICIDTIRRRSRLTIPEIIPERDDGMYQEKRILAKERLANVLGAVKSLPERQREVLILRTVEGLDYKEIEEKTGTNGIMLRVLLSKARKTLKEYEKDR